MILYVVEIEYVLGKAPKVEVLWEVDTWDYVTPEDTQKVRRDIMRHAMRYSGRGYAMYSLRRLASWRLKGSSKGQGPLTFAEDLLDF